MKILIATDAFPPGSGGSGRSTAILARALMRRGHRVRVVVSRRELRRDRSWHGVEVEEVEVPPPRFGNARDRERVFAEGLKLAAGEEAWDLVHAQHWLSAGAARRALPRLPLVVTVRDYWPVCIWSTMLSGAEPCPGCSYNRRVFCVGRNRSFLWPVAPLMPPLVGAELRRRERVLDEAAAVVAVSRHVASKLMSVEEGEVIPNVVEEPGEEPERPEGVPERYLLFVGKLEPNKAPDRLLPVLQHAGVDLPLLIAGTGSLEPALREQARRSGREVHFLGWVDEERIPALMRHADALLFPSRWPEPLSRVLLDGLGVGAVLVAEATGGSAEIVVHGESGLLARGVDELGAELARVLSDEALARSLREGAHARGRAAFSEEAVVGRLEALYRAVAESKA